MHRPLSFTVAFFTLCSSFLPERSCTHFRRQRVYPVVLSTSVGPLFCCGLTNTGRRYLHKPPTPPCYVRPYAAGTTIVCLWQHSTAPVHLGPPTSHPPACWRMGFHLRHQSRPSRVDGCCLPPPMGVPRLALGLSTPAPSYLTTCDTFPTVAFHHPPCVLPVPLGDTSLPWGIMPGAFCPPHLAARGSFTQECAVTSAPLPSFGVCPS